MVKQTMVLRGFPAVVVLVGALLGGACGGAAPRAAPIDPYATLVGGCIDGPMLNAGVSMIGIAAGEAVLGSTPGERDQARRDYGSGGERLFDDEAPVRRARVGAFRLDRSPVSNRLYAEFVAACGVVPPDAESIPAGRWEELRRFHGLSQAYAVVERFLWQVGLPPLKRETHPAVLVTHEQAGFYCAWRGARLPSEEEWERAARGPTGNVYPWGKIYDGFRVHSRLRGATDTAPVGALPQGNTREGFTDLGGHVWEWTSTPWKGRRDHYVVKGNGWDGRGGFGRGAAHESRAKDVVDVTLGFRCAADP